MMAMCVLVEQHSIPTDLGSQKTMLLVAVWRQRRDGREVGGWKLFFFYFSRDMLCNITQQLIKSDTLNNNNNNNNTNSNIYDGVIIAQPLPEWKHRSFLYILSTLFSETSEVLKKAKSVTFEPKYCPFRQKLFIFVTDKIS